MILREAAIPHLPVFSVLTAPSPWCKTTVCHVRNSSRFIIAARHLCPGVAAAPSLHHRQRPLLLSLHKQWPWNQNHSSIRSFAPAVALVSVPELCARLPAQNPAWADLISSGRADQFKETALLLISSPTSFGGLLGYTGPAASLGTYTFSANAMSRWTARSLMQCSGASKGEGPVRGRAGRQGHPGPLDRPFAGRRMSAVDQAYRYAINLPCDGSSSPPSGKPASTTKACTNMPTSASKQPGSPQSPFCSTALSSSSGGTRCSSSP